MEKLKGFINWAEKQLQANKKSKFEDKFLELKDEIAHYIDQGFTVKLLYAYLKDQGQLDCTYESFRKLVNKHIKNKGQQQVMQQDYVRS